jgi:hypothetical protein
MERSGVKYLLLAIMINNESHKSPPTKGAPVTVSKLNPAGEETWRYTGQLLERGINFLTLEAYFNREDVEYHGLFLGKGDRFVETYYTDRWYNIFEIHSRQDDSVTGWYCNIGCPAEINGDCLSYVDLALDLIVYPDGRQLRNCRSYSTFVFLRILREFRGDKTKRYQRQVMPPISFLSLANQDVYNSVKRANPSILGPTSSKKIPQICFQRWQSVESRRRSGSSISQRRTARSQSNPGFGRFSPSPPRRDFLHSPRFLSLPWAPLSPR